MECCEGLNEMGGGDRRMGGFTRWFFHDAFVFLRGFDVFADIVFEILKNLKNDLGANVFLGKKNLAGIPDNTRMAFRHSW